MASVNRWLAGRRNKDASFPHVEYRCEMECYGYPENAPFGEVCSGCINPLTSKNNSSSVAVVGAGVHIGGGAVKEIRKFLDLAVHTVFLPSKGGNVVYEGLLPYLAPNVPEHPFLDVYPLMRSCTMANCSYDGIHRSRYVNRWKAQLLLNTLCEVLE